MPEYFLSLSFSLAVRLIDAMDRRKLRKPDMLACLIIELVLYQADGACEYKNVPEGKIADCSGRTLYIVPSTIDKDISYNLNDNEIHSLLNESFESLSRLKKLNLSKNKIRAVDMCSFCKLTHLHDLHMSYNPDGLQLMRTVTYGLQFANISNVHFTNMENPYGTGKIIYSDHLDLAKNTSIKRLYVSGNMIIEAAEDESAFNNFPPELEVLDVGDNRPVLVGYLTFIS